MKYRKLGRTGLLVSEVCLGTMTFGNQIDEATSINLIKWAVDHGVNFIDTADLYVEGKTEQIVGKALKGMRDQVVLATKAGAWKSGPTVNDIGLSRKFIMKCVEDSLRRLDVDYVDVYYAHKPESVTPIDETLRAMDGLVRQGKVRHIACSNFWSWQLAKSLWMSDKLNLARFECIQPPYNLLVRDIEQELLPFCASESVGVAVFNPLAAGLLTGKHDPAKAPEKSTRFSNALLGKVYYARYWQDANFGAVGKIKELCQKSGKSMAQFALAWILKNPAITSVICGSNSVEQLEENLGAVELKVTPEEIAVCDEIWNQLHPPRFAYGSQQTVRG